MDLYGEIDARAQVLTDDNFEAVKRHMASNAGDSYAHQHLLELIKAVMNIGASVMLEKGVPNVPGEVENNPALEALFNPPMA